MQSKPTTTGRAKTVLVFGQGRSAKAIVTTVAAKLRRRSGGTRLTFTGPVVFGAEVVDHFHQTMLLVVDGIAQQLGLKHCGFELSIVNLGAASASDVGLSISGYSADTAVLLTLLSAELKMPLGQDIVATGHVASSDGDIRPVRSIPVKLAAVVQDPDAGIFIYPSVDADSSLQVLSPGEKERTEAAIIDAKGKIRTIAVGDVCELVRVCFCDEAVVLGALRSGFFELEEIPDHQGTPIERAARFLAEGNEQRFWRVLENQLLSGSDADAKKLLLARARYQVRQERYPDGFGRKLLQLVRSLPPAMRRLKMTFPLLPMDKCLQLCRFADRNDHKDVQHLLDAALGRVVGLTEKLDSNVEAAASSPSAATAAVDIVLGQISAEALAEKIGLPIDTARATYVMPEVTIESHEIFHDTIAGFYLALLRHTDAAVASTDSQAVAAEAYSLLERAFRDQGGADAALAEARHGTNGGVRLVLNVMTEQFKTEQQAKHVSRVLKEAIDPLDWDASVAFMDVFLKRIGPQLPPEIRSQPPQRFARHYQDIIQTYVRSLDRVKELLRTF